MNVIKAKSVEELNKKAAVMIAGQMLEKPDSVLGFATGSSPLGTYAELIRLYQEGTIDFRQVTTFNLDEYVGLGQDHPQSYHYFMKENLFSKVNIKAENTHIPSGVAADAQAECRRYEEAIGAAGGVDLQLLGLGRNGHIGFNEPDSIFGKETSVVKLTESTIEANTRFFESPREVPKEAISMGIGTIMKARKILLIAYGADKKEAIEKLLNGEVSPQMPASILQLHPQTTIIYAD
ncbi:glucosamine-6-phosphate deaminase [Lachnospiraceae bacterium PF1-21]|uniref:glucosamine-6-phosphate deaminase n=1 Tax=Ohessyouella blattaphilus TaxID=2949333 RepID=UPI003E325CBD